MRRRALAAQDGGVRGAAWECVGRDRRLAGGELLPVAPRQPVGRRLGDAKVMTLQLRQIVERVDPGMIAGVDQAHIEVANLRSAQGLIEERVLAMSDRLLDELFTLPSLFSLFVEISRGFDWHDSCRGSQFLGSRC